MSVPCSTHRRFIYVFCDWMSLQDQLLDGCGRQLPAPVSAMTGIWAFTWSGLDGSSRRHDSLTLCLTR